MDNRIHFDPNNMPYPDFTSDRHATSRRGLIRDPESPDIQNDEQAAQFLRAQWEEDRAHLINRYQAQIQADEAEAAQKRQEEEEAAKRKEEEQHQHDLEVAQEQEKRRAPLFDFQPGIFVELWYFTADAYQEATEHRRKPETNVFELAAEDEDNRGGRAAPFTLLGTHSERPSPNAKPDEDLTWEQILRAKTTFLDALPGGGYPEKFIDMFAKFYVNMELHPELKKPEGDKIMILYHAEMRRAWYLANQQGKTFDLATISERILQQCKEEIQVRKNRSGMWSNPVQHVLELTGSIYPPEYLMNPVIRHSNDCYGHAHYHCRYLVTANGNALVSSMTVAMLLLTATMTHNGHGSATMHYGRDTLMMRYGYDTLRLWL
ncbi:hypothetical protein EV360DRAFT_80292 [Lentinula raphanica]|nr:hypothetical protein EV360DRAFT_80292 [Lentinula raphanica]